MRVVADTHALAWFLEADQRPSVGAREVLLHSLRDPDGGINVLVPSRLDLHYLPAGRSLEHGRRRPLVGGHGGPEQVKSLETDSSFADVLSTRALVDALGIDSAFVHTETQRLTGGGHLAADSVETHLSGAVDLIGRRLTLQEVAVLARRGTHSRRVQVGPRVCT